ncbi:unnamed protein product [Parajaminaea phylloscopi]
MQSRAEQSQSQSQVRRGGWTQHFVNLPGQKAHRDQESMSPSQPPLTEKARGWLAKDPDELTRSRLQALLDDNDEEALQQAFGSRLAFGTAGLRGVMGVGPNNMNRLLIREATAGLGNYLLASKPECREQSVVIAYDGRHGSKIFAHDAAGVLAALGLAVRLFDREAPTPLGAFAVKTLGTAAGIVVTASHNPPEFNGYKVYQAGGTQINTPVDAQIAEQIDKVAAQSQGPKCLSLEQADQAGLLKWLSDDVFDAYAARVIDYLAPGKPTTETLAERAALKIAYTPMHGVGDPVAQTIFARAGFKQVWTVEEQRRPDGDFPTVNFPNPEEAGAMDLVHALAERHGAHISIANDPDADRLSVSARNKSGQMQQMTGDQIGTILGDELLRGRHAQAGNDASVWSLSTIVSSRLLARAARTSGTSHRETLTGFKWLGNVARNLHQSGAHFAFAYEEALGYMVTTEVWDKDGLSALLLLSLLASKLHTHGQTLWTRLEEVHRRVGLGVTFPRTIRLKAGVSGDSIMGHLRSNLPTTIAGVQVSLVDDLLEKPKEPTEDGEIPRNDVIRFYVGDASGMSREDILLSLPRIIIRPSGTEPKVKIYCESRIEILKDGEVYEDKISALQQELEALADGFVALVAP